MADTSPLSAEQISEYVSLNPYTRSWEIPRENVTMKQIIWKGAKKTLIAVKMLKGTKK